MNTWKTALLVAAVALMPVIACTAIGIALPTDTPEPSATNPPTPTATPRPTSTPRPTATATPASRILTDAATGARLLQAAFEGFPLPGPEWGIEEAAVGPHEGGSYPASPRSEFATAQAMWEADTLRAMFAVWVFRTPDEMLEYWYGLTANLGVPSTGPEENGSLLSNAGTCDTDGNVPDPSRPCLQFVVGGGPWSFGSSPQINVLITVATWEATQDEALTESLRLFADVLIRLEGVFGAAAAPTEAPPGALLPEVYVRPFCNCTETAALGQTVFLRWGWVATTEELTRAYIDASSQRVWIDGSADPVLWSIGDSDWGEITWNDAYQGYASTWFWQLPPLPRGTHRIEIEVTLSEAVSDGYDMDSDGQPDLYGPGVVSTGWVELVVH